MYDRHSGRTPVVLIAGILICTGLYLAQGKIRQRPSTLSVPFAPTLFS